MVEDFLDMAKHYTVPAGRELMLDSALEGRDMLYLFIMKGGRLCRETVEQMYGCDL